MRSRLEQGARVFARSLKARQQYSRDTLRDGLFVSQRARRSVSSSHFRHYISTHRQALGRMQQRPLCPHSVPGSCYQDPHIVQRTDYTVIRHSRYADERMRVCQKSSVPDCNQYRSLHSGARTSRRSLGRLGKSAYDECHVNNSVSVGGREAAS